MADRSQEKDIMKSTNPSSTAEKKQKVVVKQVGQYQMEQASQQAGELPQHFLQATLQYQDEVVRDQQKDCVLGYN